MITRWATPVSRKKALNMWGKPPDKPRRYRIRDIDWMFVHRPDRPPPRELLEVHRLVESSPTNTNDPDPWYDWIDLFADELGPLGTLAFFSNAALKANPDFVTIGQFFTQYRPVREPFAVIQTDWTETWTEVWGKRKWLDNIKSRDTEVKEMLDRLRSNRGKNLQLTNVTAIRPRGLSRLESALSGDLPMPFFWVDAGYDPDFYFDSVRPHGRSSFGDGDDMIFLFEDCMWEFDGDDPRCMLEDYDPDFEEPDEGPYDLIQIKSLMLGTRAGRRKGSQSRTAIPAHVRMFVWQRDEGKCVECESRELLEFDHIIPVSKGGSRTERNVQLLCEPCNLKKSNKI